MNTLKCNFCDKEFDKLSSMTNHRRWHDLPQYKEFQNVYRRKISVKGKLRKSSLETRKKISETRKSRIKEGKFVVWNKGKPHLYGNLNPSKRIDVRIKISNKLKGRKFSNIWRQNISKTRIRLYKEGKLENLRKLISDRSKMQVGAKSPTWKGGLSFEPYSVDFNNQLKNSIIQYYNYKCQICFTKQNNRKLDVHHINYNKKDSRE
ncbi:MAG: hypothetical protein AABY22_35575, partial [Nanoarchaeota archaeon]